MAIHHNSEKALSDSGTAVTLGVGLDMEIGGGAGFAYGPMFEINFPPLEVIYTAGVTFPKEEITVTQKTEETYTLDVELSRTLTTSDNPGGGQCKLHPSSTLLA